MTAAGASGSAVDPVPGAPLESDSFPKQWRIVKATSTRNLIVCGRQFGKTNAFRRRAHDKIVRGVMTLYVGRIRRNVREQFFLPLKDALSRAKVDYDRNEADMILRHASGGLSMAISIDDISDIEKGRGFTWGDVMIDEAQSHKDEVLTSFIEKIITPTLFKEGGTLNLGGTIPDPEKGESMNCYFTRLIHMTRTLLKEGKRAPWEYFQESTLDNPHIPAQNVYDGYAALGIGPGHPIWEAEVMGNLVENPAARVFPYEATRNSFTDQELAKVLNGEAA